ncbi:hypothetical protein A5707_10015 [Mycobacterium kyorinense]|uniref:Uncharacterized protein n=1 Tax=Mycobacterium kyorinense TaxID=487514 RepID=A0A1A2YS28_9MYCO|nr:hypothetical protein A5707_10015 [Mycobacterium kyorinense]
MQVIFMSYGYRYISRVGIVGDRIACHSDQVATFKRADRGLFISLLGQLPDELIQMSRMKGEETEETITLGEVLVER